MLTYLRASAGHRQYIQSSAYSCFSGACRYAEYSWHQAALWQVCDCTGFGKRLDSTTPLHTMIQLCSLLLAVCWIAGANAHGHDPFRVLFQAENAVVALDSSVTIQIDTTTFSRDMQPVKVTVTNTNANQSQYDYVALYSPPNPTDYTQTIPVWYDQLINLGRSYQATNNYQSSGTVTFTFNLINWRSDFQFVVVRGANKLNPLSDPIILAQSGVIINTIVDAPGQVHMNLDVDQQSMVIQWVSANPSQSVKWGSQPGQYSDNANSNTLRYTKEQMCGGIAKTVGWRDPGNLHQATIPASHRCMKSERVYYRVGSDATGWSDEFSFIPPSRSTERFTFLMFNDVGIKLPSVFNDICGASDSRFCGQKPANYPNDTYFAAPDFQGNDSYFINSTKLSDNLPQEKDAALALLIGDVSYAQGYHALWDWFGYQFQASFAQWPLALGIGNHERDWPGTGDAFNNIALDSGGECGVPYRYRYRPLSAAINGYDVQNKDYYSFNYGPVHYIVLDGETPSDKSSDQYKYVSKDLASLNRQKYPWVVVGVHRMMLSYPTTFNGSITSDMGVMARLQADWFDLFYQYQVDVVVSGHNHAYSRSCPIRPDKKCYTYSNTTSYQNPRGIVFVQAGNGGAGFTNNFDWGYWERTGIKNYMIFARQFQNGYLRFKASKTRLSMEAVSDDDRTTFDNLLLKKTRSVGRHPGVFNDNSEVPNDTNDG